MPTTINCTYCHEDVRNTKLAFPVLLKSIDTYLASFRYIRVEDLRQHGA